LIFDEIVTGFRINVGGAQSEFGVIPDLACFGKAMGNGMPISAIVGRRELMRTMEDIFFSGTFGGEALSLAASIATVNKLIDTDTPAHVRRTGKRLKQEVAVILDRYGLSTRYAVKGPDWKPMVVAQECGVPGPVVTSLMRQELLANGIMMGSAFNLCLAHDESVVDSTLTSWENACDAVAAAFNDRDPARHLRGRPIQPVFQVRKD
jgi:glutamate-1-semialdehyde 2,1-aminomutase